MEKWKIAAIVALLAALPVYGYFVDSAKKLPPSENPATGTPTNAPESIEKPAEPPPSYLMRWWGQKPPAFSFPQELWTNTDKPVQLADLRGKVVLLELWRAECSHCQFAAPIIERLAEENKSKGLEVVGIHCSAEKNTIEYDWNAIKQKLPQLGIKYPVAFDEKRTLFDKFQAKKFPSLFVIDRQGVIRYANEGMTPPLKTELEAAIKQVLDGKNPRWPPSKAESAEDAALKYAPDKN